MIVRTPAQGKELVPYRPLGAAFSPRPPGLLKRMVQAWSERQLTGGWFSPELPLVPAQPQTAGRQFDYTPGYNLWIQPKRDTGFLFEDLKAFAKWYDILRLMIQTRMDQVTGIEWSIAPTDPNVRKRPGGKLQPAEQKAADELTRFFTRPDGETRWRGWLRAVLNDVFVLDGIALWPRYEGRRVAALERIDVASIKRVIDNSGRTPDPPYPAYQQILHGQVANEYRRGELLYYMENPGNDRVYGLSRVEQAMMSIQIGMRQEMQQLQFFTEGTIPDALASVPDSWTSDQIRDFQNWWDTMLEGDTAQRRKLKFIPDAVKVLNMKPPDAILKPEQNEWIVRILCYAFSLSPQPFIKMMNRATAESAQEEAKEEGLAPFLGFLEETLTDVIQGPLGYPDFQFVFEQQEDVDPETQAKVDDTYVKNGILSIDEVRDRMGKPPLGIGHMIYLTTGPLLVDHIKDGTYTPQGVASPQDQEKHDAVIAGIKSGKLGADGKPPAAAKPAIADGSTPEDKDLQEAKEDAGITTKHLRKGGRPGRSEPFREGRTQRHHSRGGRDPARRKALEY